MLCSIRWAFLIGAAVLCWGASSAAGDIKGSRVYARIKKQLDAVPGIDTHSHPGGPKHRKDVLEYDLRGDKRLECALCRVWRASYFTWGRPLTPWPAGGRF